MVFFFRCLCVFILCWIGFFFLVWAGLWEGANAFSAGFLYGGVMSIGATVIYGLFDELWLQHRQF